MHPTLPTLLRISMVFSVGLEHFFNPEPKPVVEIVRKKERLRFPDAVGSDAVNYHFESLDFRAENRKVNAFYAEFEVVEASQVRLHQHPGIEFLYLLSGKLVLRIGEDETELTEGDAAYFDSSVLHGYRKSGSRRTAALVVTS